MSFFASFHYVRPGKLPRVSGDELAQWVRFIAGLVLVKPGRQVSASPGDREEDEAKQFPDLEQRAAFLRGQTHAVSRAFIGLGYLEDEVTEALLRLPSPENDMPLSPDSLSITLGDIDLESFEAMAPGVGSMAFSVSGHGYLYPWTLCDFAARAEAHARIAALMADCRLRWPVSARRPGWLSRRRHEKLTRRGLVWPHAEASASANWHWGVSEG